MISTSSYKNWQSDKYRTYSISGDYGIRENYRGNYFPILAPKFTFWNIWLKNRNNERISEEENNKYYIEQYYKQVLEKLDPLEVYNYLNNSTLLCYEENMEFCHRHIVAAWFEILLSVEVFEKKANGYDVVIMDRPSYIKEYLKEVMRKNRNMKGFNSLRALYLFEKGEKLEKEAKKLKDKYDDSTFYISQKTKSAYDRYMNKACFFRCEADKAEEQYNQQKENDKKITKKI